MTVAADVLLARACLQRAQRMFPAGLGGLIEQFGPLDALRRLRAGTAAHPRSPQLIKLCARQAEADLGAADRLGISLLTPEHDGWPTRRLASYRTTQPARPIALWVRGDPDLARLIRHAVTVLAEPFCGAYGIEVADTFGGELAHLGITVISDAGPGIPATLQRSAIRSRGGRTNLIVLPSGADVPCPPGSADILQQVAEHGAIVTAQPPGAPPESATRNRQLGAALSAVTLLVQANPDSPVLHTARAMAGHTRLLAVPGPITSRGSAGTNNLLRERIAHAVTSAADISDDLLALENHGP